MLSRDARHIALPQVGVDGQQRIASASVLLIGVGGIGCATGMYLASSGVGRILLSDFDTVDETNLGRQVLYAPNDVGELKANVAAQRLRTINPYIRVDSFAERFDDDAMRDAVSNVDVVLDGSDNFATRFQVNDACVATGRILVSGAAIRMEGQLAVFGPDYASSPCYRCLYRTQMSRSTAVPETVSCRPSQEPSARLMAVEALKLLVGIPAAVSRLHLYDATATEFRSLTIHKRKDCPTCAASAAS